MKSLAMLLGVFYSITLVAGAQDSARDADVAARLTSLESAKFDARQRKDLAALNAIFDDDLTIVDQAGTMLTKPQFLASSHESAAILLRIVPGSMSVRVFGSIVIVVGIYEEKGIKSGHSYAQHCRFIDTWAFQHGKWVCIAETETPVIT